MTIRPVHPDEYDALAALTVAAYQAILGPDMNPRYVAELADVAGRAVLVDVLVAVDDEGRLLGGTVYIPGPGPMAWFDDPDAAGMRMLAVDPSVQSRGVGAGLVADCVSRATAAGRSRLLLHTTSPMTAAQRLYERAGFRHHPEHDEVIGEGLLLLAYSLELRK